MAVVIDIGDLREVIKFEKNIATQEDSGGEMDGYVEFLTTRGRIRQNGAGGRSLQAGSVLLDNTYELVVRYQQALQNELTDTGTVRIVYNGRFFTIHEWTILEERQRFYVFTLATEHI